MVAARFLKTSKSLKLAAGLALLASLQACIPVVMVGAMAGAAMVGTDRRSTGVQAIDRGIQLETESKLQRAADDYNHLNATVFNRKVLLTGEVRDAAHKERFVQATKANTSVREVQDNLVIGRPSTFQERSEDIYITGIVKTQLTSTSGVPTNSMRIFTEAGVVYLMGLVTEKEGKLAAETASTVKGVKQVVKAFDYISEAERDKIEGERRSTATPTTE